MLHFRPLNELKLEPIMSRLCVLSASLCALLFTPARALALDPTEAGVINAELAEKEKAIKEEYGNRTIKQMSRDERKEMDQKLRDARQEVLEKHGTTDKEYSKGMVKLGRDGLKEAQRSEKEHATKLEEAKKGAQGGKDDGKGEITVQRGFGDEAPVVVEEDGIQVQRGGGKEGIEIPVGGGE